MADPYPKSRQLARGAKRYRRKVASPKQWAAIRAEKLTGEPCRIHSTHDMYGGHLHHLVPRARGGDDVAENLVPVCPNCHAQITRNRPEPLLVLAENLTDPEYAYVIAKLGEGAMQRLFGV